MEEYVMYVVIAYFAIVNIVAFAMMGIDKQKAIKGKWRIPEKSLFISAIIGGAIGANLGMQVFRHKTKHIQFVVGMPLILILWIAGIVYFVLR